MISILTPSYNRAYILENAYKSLLRQTNKDFEWVIVDDGSTDDTEKLVKRLIKEKKIDINYTKKENGGKHTALNEGMKYVKGELTIILDSDDYLLDDAIETIYYYWKKYKKNKNICGLSFLRQTEDNKTIGKRYKEDIVISNNIDFRYNKGILGDMCEVYITNVLKKYSFPVYNNERFLSECIIWNEMAMKYDTVYINKPIYVCEYLEDGLSKNSLIVRTKCPLGALENAKLFMNKRFKLSIRLKNSILYSGFSLVARKNVKEIVSYSNHKVLTILGIIPGYLLYLYLYFKVINKDK